MARRAPLLLAAALALAACRADPPAPEPPDARPPAEAALDPPTGVLPETTEAVRPAPAPPTPFDAATVVFDTSEPPERVVRIPPRPTPTPPRPTPRPTPPARPPAPDTRGPSGSCDVRASEGYCFAFTGDAWTPDAARGRCAAAPSAAFDPGTCPLADRVATCAYERPSTPGREIVYTYYAPYDIALAELACPGTFTRIE